MSSSRVQSRRCSSKMSPHSKEDSDNGPGITFSKVKYRFQNMLTEVRALKTKEHAARMEVDSLVQKLRTMEGEHEKVKASLHAQINESVEARQKLESSVKLMGLDVSAMENKVKASKLQLKAVLESRNMALEETKIAKYELEQKLNNVSSQLAVAMEKLSRNSMLFEAVEGEASSVKRVLEETRQLVSSRAETVIKLQQQAAWMVESEQKVLEKARVLESEVKCRQQSLCEKDKEILALKTLLETKQLDSDCQRKLALIQNAFVAKDRTISQLNADKQNLLGETESLKLVTRRLQVTVQEQELAMQALRENLLKLQSCEEEFRRQEGSKSVKEARDESTSTDDILELGVDLEEAHRNEQHAETLPYNEDGEDIALQAEPSVAPAEVSSEEPKPRLQTTETVSAEQGPQEIPADDIRSPIEDVDVAKEKEDKIMESVVIAPQPHSGAVTFSTCVCGLPPDAEMVSCGGCGNQFHAACVSRDEQSSVCLCTRCKEQPAMKRLRVDVGS